MIVRNQRAEELADFGLGDAHFAAEGERRAWLHSWLLHDLREPCNNPIVVSIIAPSDIVAKMSQELRAVALARLDGESAPEIVVAVSTATGCELDALILSSLQMAEPMLCYRHLLLADPTV